MRLKLYYPSGGSLCAMTKEFTTVFIQKRLLNMDNQTNCSESKSNRLQRELNKIKPSCNLDGFPEGVVKTFMLGSMVQLEENLLPPNDYESQYVTRPTSSGNHGSCNSKTIFSKQKKSFVQSLSCRPVQPCLHRRVGLANAISLSATRK